MNVIENEQLYRLLSEIDKFTLQIILWKIEGHSSMEIFEKCGLSVSAVNFRMWHLRRN